MLRQFDLKPVAQDDIDLSGTLLFFNVFVSTFRHVSVEWILF